MTPRLLFTTWLAFVSATSCPASELVRALNGREIAAAVASAESSWTSTDTGFGGSANGTWSYSVLKPITAADYSAEFRVTLVKPADRRDGTEMGAYVSYRAHADLGGYEAAVAVRYESPDRHYRIAISSLWQELNLWRPNGGILQVVSHPFQTGKSYTLRVTCRGDRITVEVDGTKRIDWWDTADPVRGGTVALARKEGEAYFESLRVTKETKSAEAAPAHRPKFAERKWHDQRWFFDGAEPLFTLRDDNVLDHMKFRPGYRAAMYAFNFVTDWASFYPNRINNYEVVESGNQLVVAATAVDRTKSTGIECRSRLTVSYDASRNMYVYEHACTVTIPEAAAANVASDWDHGDSVFLGSVGSAQTRDPLAMKPHYLWSVFETPEGKYFKVPHNHNGHYIGRSSTNGGPIRANGGRVVAVGDSVLSPVIEFGPKSSQFGKCSVGLCWWGYDVHTIFSAERVNDAIQPGQYVSTVRYTAIPAADANKLFKHAELYEPLDANVTIPVFTAGVGHTEPFDREVVLATPHTEHRIWGGLIDRTIGRGDKASLRLDGPIQAWTLTGPSYFVAPYGKRNRVTAWVKTQDVVGQGPTIGFRRLDTNTLELHATGITGTRDWTQISYVTDFPGESFGVMIYFRNSGGGTVWIDQFRVEPVSDDTPLSVSPLPQTKSTGDVLLDWRSAGDAFSVLDTSEFGHHGRLFGGAKWTASTAAANASTSKQDQVIELDGTGYIWPLTSPRLTLGPETTLFMDIKPETEGTLVWWGFQFTISTVGHGEQSIEYRPAGGAPVRSRPFLKTGAWQKLAIVMRADRTQLYSNGSLVDELPVVPMAGNWSLHDQSTWHRHLSFFGGGPGNMTLVKEDPAYCWKGQVRSLRVLGRAATREDVQRQAAE